MIQLKTKKRFYFDSARYLTEADFTRAPFSSFTSKLFTCKQNATRDVKHYILPSDQFFAP